MLIHYATSIAAHVSGKGLTAGQVAILYALWAGVRNPFTEQPVVWATYADLARLTGLDASTVRQHTAKLKRAGCFRKGKSARGRGTEYTLLRPEHSADDATRNPFDPSEAETAAEEAVAMLRGDGQVAKPKVKPKRERTKKPAIKPSDLATAIEDAVGYDRKENGKPHNRYSLGKKQPAPWIAAAQRFIDAHGRESFDRVLAAAAKRDWSDRPEHKDRIYLFESKALVDELLAASEAVTATPIAERVGDYSPEAVARGLAKYGVHPDDARALVQSHWPSIAAIPFDSFRAALVPWKASPADQRASSLATTLASIANPT